MNGYGLLTQRSPIAPVKVLVYQLSLSHASVSGPLLHLISLVPLHHTDLTTKNERKKMVTMIKEKNNTQST
ncbi:hypothetical protein E2C01_005807 [Portunus trituberculatus]|uniref:Uncharacterized protein n=1 Tax=Portunus trituberculatus TaxID=210409 RepID=A0A5B7CTC7_PORTR|nr:hypothetical protein [Portunus trituberculatus]